MPQQAPPPPGPAYLPSPLATLGFTAIAPAGQTLVQPIVGQPPLLAPAPPLSCQSQTPTGQASANAGRQVKKNKGLYSVTSRIYFLLMAFCPLFDSRLCREMWEERRVWHTTKVSWTEDIVHLNTSATGAPWQQKFKKTYTVCVNEGNLKTETSKSSKSLKHKIYIKNSLWFFYFPNVLQKTIWRHVQFSQCWALADDECMSLWVLYEVFFSIEILQINSTLSDVSSILFSFKAICSDNLTEVETQKEKAAHGAPEAAGSKVLDGAVWYWQIITTSVQSH